MLVLKLLSLSVLGQHHAWTFGMQVWDSVSSGGSTVGAIATLGRTVHVECVQILRELQADRTEAGQDILRDFWPSFLPMSGADNPTCVSCNGDLKEGSACVVVGDESGGLLQWDQMTMPHVDLPSLSEVRMHSEFYFVILKYTLASGFGNAKPNSTVSLASVRGVEYRVCITRMTPAKWMLIQFLKSSLAKHSDSTGLCDLCHSFRDDTIITHGC